MRSIKNLINSEKKVYILLKTEDIANQFMANAEAEGFTFSDGVKPSSRKPDDVMALLPDGTMCYVGSLGRMYRKSEHCICVDYEEYLKR